MLLERERERVGMWEGRRSERGERLQDRKEKERAEERGPLLPEGVMRRGAAVTERFIDMLNVKGEVKSPC